MYSTHACRFVSNTPHDSATLPMSLQAIMQAAQLKADGKAQRVIVTGCLAQRYSEDLAGSPLPPHTCQGIQQGM